MCVCRGVAGSCGCEGQSSVAVRGKTESRVRRVHEVDGIVWLCGRVVVLAVRARWSSCVAVRRKEVSRWALFIEAAILTEGASECGRGLDEEANEEKMVRWWDGQPDEGRGTRKGIGEEGWMRRARAVERPV